MRYQPVMQPLDKRDEAVRDLVALLRVRAREQPQDTAYIFLPDGETEGACVTFSDLDRRARTIAARLQSMQMAGQRALLLYPPGLDYIEALFGCLYAGAIAVPAYPPSRHHVNRLRGVLQDAEPALFMTTIELYEKLSEDFSGDRGASRRRWLATDTPDQAAAEPWAPPCLAPDSLAFLQYTSGSTGQPKGVMISHRNLLANQAAIKESFQHTESTIVVGWLPMYHDMGLIGNILQPLYLGSRAILMSPLSFMEQPVRWLRAISRYRATTSGGPNFAYELCIRKVAQEQKRDLDLSTWSVAFNGAEPVRATTLERFSEAFAECGFHREAFFPCYGLAEATLFVAGPNPGSGLTFKPPISLAEDAVDRDNAVANAQHSKLLVGCGRTWTDHEMRIVDPATGQECANGRIGEIWVTGPSVAQGYWHRPEESAQVFHTRRAEDGGKPFLRTGDLGFVHQDELFVAGRLKDLIILRGRNYYPQDFERLLDEYIEDLRPGCNAAFSVVFDEEETLVIVAEVQSGPYDIYMRMGCSFCSSTCGRF